MSGRTLVFALVLVVFAVPTQAVAKGVEDAQVCGAGGCVEAPLDADTYIVFDTWRSAFDGRTATVPAPADPGPYYELRYRAMKEDGAEPVMVAVRRRLYPRPMLVRAEDGQWVRPSRRAVEALLGRIHGVEPIGVADRRSAPSDAGAGGDGTPIVPLLALTLLAAGAALALGSRRRRRPAAG